VSHRSSPFCQGEPAGRSSRGDTAQVPPIQVGTPIAGKTQRITTNQPTNNPVSNRRSDIAFPFNIALESFRGTPYNSDALRLTVFL